MSAMERIGSYIRSGVYNVAAPFHPFGGAVDIIVIEQQDGTFKSSPWYVKFGKFQGVLKRKEKLVSISVNGAAADFTMFLDHKGEAYFLRESVSNGRDEEEEIGSTALSSGEDSESGTRGKKGKVDQRGFNSDDDRRRIPGDEAAIVVRSDSKRIPWLSFGRRSIKSEGKDGSVDRVSSMERAQIVSDLLDTKWSMNLPSGRRKGAREASPSDSSSVGISKFGSSGAPGESSMKGSLSLEDAVTVNSMEPREVGAVTSGRETETSLIASAISEKSSIENALLLRDAVDAVAETVLDSTVPVNDGMNSPVAVSNLANPSTGSSAVSSELVYIAAEHSELNEKSDEAVEEASSLPEGVSVIAAAARIDIQEDAVAAVVEQTMQVSSSEPAALDGLALTDAHLLVSDELMLKQHTCSETRHDESGKGSDSYSGHTDSFNNNNSVLSEHTPVLEQNYIVSEHVELETSCDASGPPESSPSTLDRGYFACERETAQFPDTSQQNVRTCEDVSGLPNELLHNKDELASFSDIRCEPFVAADQAIQKDDPELRQIEVGNSSAATIPDEEKLIDRTCSFVDSSSELHFVPGSSSNRSSHACHGVRDPSKFDMKKEDARNNSVLLGSSLETETDQNRSKKSVECDSLEGDVFQMDDIPEMDNTETGKVQGNNVEEDKILKNRIEAVDDGAVSTNSSRFELLHEEIHTIDSSRYITSAEPDTENEINALAHVSEDVRFQESKDFGLLAINGASKLLDIESLVVTGTSTPIESDYHRVFLSENGNTTDPVGPVADVAFKEFELSLNNGYAITEPAEPVLAVAHKEFESSVMHRLSSSSSDSMLVFNSRANETSTSCACGGSSLNEAENSQPMNVSKGHKDDSENTLLSKSLPIIKTGISYPESFDSRGIRTVGSNYKLLKYEALSKAFQRSPPGSVSSRTGESDKPSACHAPDLTGFSENKDQNSLERLPGFPDVEVSLCKHLLREGMGIEAASKAFDSNKVSLTQFSSLGQSIIKNDKLTVRIDGRYYPWDAAAPILLGMATFGPGRTIKSKGMIAVEKVEDALVKYPSSSWRLWPFARRSKTFGHTRSLPDGSIVDAAKDPLELSLDGTSESSVSRRGIKKERSLIPTSEQLASLNLKEGRNIITFAFSTAMLGKQEVDARIYRWKWDTKIVISDVDGTITKSDVLGQVMPLVGRDWSQTGVAHLFSAIKENGYQVMFLSARAISQAYLTRQFLGNLKQDGKALPDGPVVISPDGLFPSLFREVVRRAPHEFKIACLEDIRALFPSDVSPFYAGFGNRDTDEISYLKVGIPKGKIFIINPKGEVAVNNRIDTRSYSSLHDLVNGIFPARTTFEQEDYNQWNFWKMPLPDIDI